MNSQYAPIVRIALRYLAAFTGAASLATDADLIAVGCLLIGAAVEVATIYAKRTGKPT